MPKYAEYDHRAAQPAPVVGWYDTDNYPHPTMPDPANLLELTDAQWKVHFAGQWAVNNGAIEPYEPVPFVPDVAHP